MKLKTKIHLYSTLLMLLILVITNVGIYYIYSQNTYETELQQLRTESESLVHAISQMTESTNPATVLRAYSPANGGVRIVNTLGEIEVAVNTTDQVVAVKVESVTEEIHEVKTINGTKMLTLSVPIIDGSGAITQLQIIQVLTDVERNLTELKLILISITLVGTIPILISSIVLGKIVTQPIQKLIGTMKRIQNSGNYERIKTKDDRKDELAHLEYTFNDTMKLLERNYKKQEQFVSDASHELKTPLTVIESYASLVNRRGISDPKIIQEATQAILEESVRMRDMIEQMLQLARYDEEMVISRQTIELLPVINQTLRSMKQAYHRKFNLIIDPDFETITYKTDEQKLKQLLFIFLDNARKYSEDEIDMHMTETTNLIKIAITDRGIGIPKDAIPHVFDRFYRVDEARNRKTGGTGLGLSLAKEIAKGLQIKLVIESDIDAGTTVTLELPKI
ncbi:sensor histidine kinase [Paenisporosarcina antarctica]|uniref:histidine kinase n=1 Tax=Paenisporosarcina antarctica TaxID=417367 RepID=A0A4P6ZZW4_9BACL|nr:ATP-binding protein [Paenisporosarcina antarctica]QBP41649.1 HAMP domain-containing histidine kinase [Paenisporosarcina antarctica]